MKSSNRRAPASRDGAAVPRRGVTTFIPVRGERALHPRSFCQSGDLVCKGGREAIKVSRNRGIEISRYWGIGRGNAAEYRDHSVEFHAINVRESRSRVESFIAEQEWDVSVLMDPDREAWNAFGIAALPTTVIIDEKGIVRAVFQGYSPWLKAQLRYQLDSLLEENRP